MGEYCKHFVRVSIIGHKALEITRERAALAQPTRWLNAKEGVKADGKLVANECPQFG